MLPHIPRGIQIKTAPLYFGNNVVISHKMKLTPATDMQQSHSQHLLKRNLCSHKNLYVIVYSCFIHKSPRKGKYEDLAG